MLAGCCGTGQLTYNRVLFVSCLFRLSTFQFSFAHDVRKGLCVIGLTSCNSRASHMLRNYKKSLTQKTRKVHHAIGIEFQVLINYRCHFDKQVMQKIPIITQTRKVDFRLSPSLLRFNRTFSGWFENLRVLIGATEACKLPRCFFHVLDTH